MDQDSLTTGDVHALLGHAEYLQRVNGEVEMPTFFRDLARRIAKSFGDEDAAERCAELLKRGKEGATQHG